MMGWRGWGDERRLYIGGRASLCLSLSLSQPTLESAPCRVTHSSRTFCVYKGGRDRERVRVRGETRPGLRKSRATPPSLPSLPSHLALVSGQAQQIFLVGFLAGVVVSVAGWAWSEGVGGPAIASKRRERATEHKSEE